MFPIASYKSLSLPIPSYNYSKETPSALLLSGLPGTTAASYSPALHCSTIGVSGLNFSVRNGKRWDPTTITT